MPDVAVLIPWRPGCAHREHALPWVLARHAANGWPVILGRGDEHGPWIKAHAVNDALEHTSAEILIIADADCWTDGLPAAADAVRAGAAWAVPHRGVHRLTEPSTTRFMAGADLHELELAERAQLGRQGGGFLVARREVYEACPMDPRFEGWGGEDESLGFALRTLHGPPVRGQAPLVHLWHPPQQRATRAFGSAAGWALRKRYARANDCPTQMTVLIEEAKAHGAHQPAQPPGRAHHPPAPV